MSFSTIPDLPFLSRRRTSADAVGQFTYYPLALSREELCRIVWSPKTIRGIFSDTWSDSGGSGSDVVNDACPWVHCVVTDTPAYSRSRPSLSEPSTGGPVMTVGTEPQHGLTQQSIARSPRSRYRHTARGGYFEGSGSASYSEDSTETHTNYSQITLSLFGSSYVRSGGSSVAVSGETTVSDIYPPDFEGSVNESSDGLLFDGASIDTATIFYPRCVIEWGGITSPRAASVDLGYDTLRGTIDFLGHPINLYSSSASGFSGNLTGSFSIEEEHRLS